MSQSRPYEMKYHDERVRENPAGKTNYRVALPKEIEKQLNWTQGDYVDIEKESGNGDQLDYLRVDKVPPDEVDTENHYIISQYSKRYVLTIPADWREDFIKHGNKEPLVVEINLAQGPDHLRIYRLPDYYRDRLPYLKEEGFDTKKGDPVFFPLVTAPSLTSNGETKEADLAFEGEHGEKKFRLIMYDAQHPLFKQKPRFSTSGTPRPSVRENVVENNELPRYPASEIRIEWAEDPDSETTRELYSSREDGIFELDVTLSETGIYTVYTQTDEGEMSAWLNYSEGRTSRMSYFAEGWGGTCLGHSDYEDFFLAYIPCRTAAE